MILKPYLIFILFVRASCQELEYVQKEYFKSNTLSDDGQGWTSGSQIKATTCASYSIIGGYGVFSGTYLKTQLINLAQHTKIRFQALFFKVDSWDLATLKIEADGVTVWQGTYDMTGDSNICGSSIYGDRIVSIDVRFPHTAETLELKLWDNNDEDPTNESWGIRDIVVSLVVECPTICDGICKMVYF